MGSNFNKRKKKDTVYHLGRKHGEKAAYDYEKRNPKKHMSFWKAINPFSNYAERFIKGYNDGYFEIVNGRKMLRANQKIDTLKKEKAERLKEIRSIQAKKAAQKARSKRDGKER